MPGMRHIVFFLLVSICTWQSAFSQNKRKIEIVDANSLEYNQNIGRGAKRLIGNVVFKHEGAMMYCDSAYFYSESNTVDAYDNVKIEQGDSLMLTGTTLKYNGNTKMAIVRKKVVLSHFNSYLETDSLNFDRSLNMGYYFNGGNIYDGDNHLFSKRGYYYADDKDYFAVDDVVLTNPEYVIYCDTLRYNTETQIAYFYGPTRIVSDSTFIYCENGNYDTKSDLASFSENAYLVSGQQTLKGDSLFYNRNIRMGKAFRNVSVTDTVENVIAEGNLGYYYENPKKAMLTDSVLVTYISDGDTVFMHADTVYVDIDSLDRKLVRAFRKVQVFRNDMQARCDSLVYCTADSVAEMFGKPVLWSNESQLTGEYMVMHFENNKAHHVEITGYALIVQEEDSARYNQIQGRKLVAYIKDNDVWRIDIFNDSQTIYFIRDEKTNDITGLNKIISSDMIIYRTDKQIEKIQFFEKPDGIVIPIKDLTESDAFLKDFVWLDVFRPKNKLDIFNWISIK